MTSKAVQKERERIINELHFRAGRCIVCCARKCLHAVTRLPDRLDTETVLSAINGIDPDKRTSDE